MTQMKCSIRACVAIALSIGAIPALAVYNEQVILTGGPDLASAQVSFAADDGQSVEVRTEQKDDRRVAYLVFAGRSGAAGTLTVTTAGQPSRSFRLPATASAQPIRVDTATGAVTVVDRAPSAPGVGGLELSLSYGIGERDVPSIPGPGITVTPDGERPILRSEENVGVTPWSFAASVGLGPGARLGFSYSQYSGDEEGHAEIAPDTVDTAIVAQQEGTSTGVFVAGFGLESEGKIEVDGHKFGVDYSWPCAHFERVNGRLGFYYAQNNAKYVQRDTVITFPDVNSVRTTLLNETSYLFTFGGGYEYPFNDMFAARVDAGLVGQIYEADMTSKQRLQVFANVQNLSLRDDDDDRALGAYLSVSFPMRFGKLWVVPTWVGSTGTSTAAAEYPTSGDEVSAGGKGHLTADNAVNWEAAIRFAVDLFEKSHPGGG